MPYIEDHPEKIFLKNTNFTLYIGLDLRSALVCYIVQCVYETFKKADEPRE